MRKIETVLLFVLFLIAIGNVAFAADAKFSGEFYLQGWYNKNASLIDQDSPVGPGNRGSSAFYTERLRMGIDFNVAKGLKFATRFDALERRWMAARKTVPTGSPGYFSNDSESENIAWEVAYVQFATPIGLFMVGNIPAGTSGPALGDNTGVESGQIIWIVPKGPWTISAVYKKSQEGYTISAAYPTGTPIGVGTDNDSDVYTLALNYRWQTGAFSTAIGEVISNTTNYPHPGGPVNTTSRKVTIPYFSTWVQQKFGKIFAEGELGLVHGPFIRWNEPFTAYTISPAIRNVDADMAMSGMFNINVDLAPAKVGFMFVYSRGDDPETMEKKEGGFRSVLEVDRSFNPCLILFNEDYMHWMGDNGTGGKKQPAALVGNAGVVNGISTYVQNVWLYQLYGDFKVTPKLNIGASFTYAYADEKPTHNGYSSAYGGVEFLSKKYGYEADLTLKYKIYDNLEYMIGAAYLWTGDFFKGTDPNVQLSNTYLITHKLTIAF